MSIMNNQPFNKDQLQQEVDAKARASVQGDAGLDELMRFTLDNFAYRYLETKNCKNLKSFATATHSWRVESRETQLLEALKAENPATKKALVERAKQHARKDGAAVILWLEIHIQNQLAVCKAGVDWESDGIKQQVAVNESRLNFDDLLMLRNRLAKTLEEACGVF